MKFNYLCPSSFFGLGPEYRPILHKMLFDMAYHSQGGFQWGDLYDMPVALRRFYWEKLMEAKEEEKKEMDKANSRNKPPPRRR